MEEERVSEAFWPSCVAKVRSGEVGVSETSLDGEIVTFLSMR